MKQTTKEALKMVAKMIEEEICHQHGAQRMANRYKGRRNAKQLHAHHTECARAREARAAALTILLANHTDLWKRLDADSGMLDYVTFAPVSGIEVTDQDRRNVRQQLKVSKHVLKLTEA